MTISPTGDPTGALAALGIQAGPQVGEEVPVRGRNVRIGRGPSNDITIDDDSVSGSHARLDWDAAAKAWRITDLGSTNGTFVETVRLAPEVPTPLPFGATVRFGTVRMHFRPAEPVPIPDGEPAAPEPTPSRVPAAANSAATLRTAAIIAGVLLLLALVIFGIRSTAASRSGADSPQVTTEEVSGQAGTAAVAAGPALPLPAEPTPPDVPVEIPPPVNLEP